MRSYISLTIRAWVFVLGLFGCVRYSWSAEPVAIDPDLELRIDSQVYRVERSQDEVLGQSLTLFYQGIVYDLLPEQQEATVFDAAHGRVILLDAARQMRCELTLVEIERFVADLKSWSANQTRDSLLKFAATPEFESEFNPDANELLMTHKLVKYRVETVKADSEAAAKACQHFWDLTAKLKAVTHPGGLPPFVRMALNKELGSRNLVPKRVELTISNGNILVPGVNTFHSTHKIANRLIASDRRKIEKFQSWMADYKLVSLDAYRERVQLTSADDSASDKH